MLYAVRCVTSHTVVVVAKGSGPPRLAIAPMLKLARLAGRGYADVSARGYF